LRKFPLNMLLIIFAGFVDATLYFFLTGLNMEMNTFIHVCQVAQKKRVRRIKTSTLIESHRSESENT